MQRFREPWVYDEDTLNISREYIKMRYRLLPVIYREAYRAYLNGEPVFRGLGWEYPDDRRALSDSTEYMLGKEILVAPLTGIIPSPVGAANYVSKVKATYFDGMKLQGEPLCEAVYDRVWMELNNVAPHKGVPVYNFSARFETDLRFEEDTKLYLCCDDGAKVWVDGELVFTDERLHSAMMFCLCDLSGGEKHHVVIDYFQAGGEAACKLYYVANRDIRKDTRTVYLPSGKWMNVFDGSVRKGKTRFEAKCDYDKMPLYVRLGALIPLAYDAKNTKEQKWDRLAFDFYPDEDSFCEGSLYEDDGETTAYQNGV